jgi:hypothetical protein
MKRATCFVKANMLIVLETAVMVHCQKIRDYLAKQMMIAHLLMVPQMLNASVDGILKRQSIATYSQVMKNGLMSDQSLMITSKPLEKIVTQTPDGNNVVSLPFIIPICVPNCVLTIMLCLLMKTSLTA